MENWDREEVWQAIHELSDIRAGYSYLMKKNVKNTTLVLLRLKH
jgi:hypothetical protein